MEYKIDILDHETENFNASFHKKAGTKKGDGTLIKIESRADNTCVGYVVDSTGIVRPHALNLLRLTKFIK